MAKRGPQSELTDRNWDDEEEPEEAGIFKQASEETMNQRVIRKAKRRGHEEGLSGAKPGAFGGFGGLVSRPGLNQISSDKTPGLKVSSANVSAFKPHFTGGAATSSVDSVETSKGESKENSSYLHGLKSLNESVLAWIKQHVDKNPYIILTPIFKDYETYLATLESKKTTSNGSSTLFTAPVTAKQSNAGEIKNSDSKKSSDESDSKKDGSEENGNSTKLPAFSFGSTSPKPKDEGFKFTSTGGNSGFSFGKNSTTSGFSFAQTQSSSSSSTAAAAAPAFSFGSSGSTSTTSSFGNAGFSFGTLAAKTMSEKSGNSQSQDGDDDEYVPPKPEVKEIKEEGSVCTKKCKLFYQHEGQWTEKGVGYVHVKAVDETKTQLLVRADTSLGNILLNVMLTSGLPTSRQGKNNVLLVCVPNPPIKTGQEDDQTPIPLLIRVKTGDEADELLAKLQERKALL